MISVVLRVKFDGLAIINGGIMIIVKPVVVISPVVVNTTQIFVMDQGFFQLTPRFLKKSLICEEDPYVRMDDGIIVSYLGG